MNSNDWINLIVSSLATLVSAGLGAYAAYHLSLRQERRRDRGSLLMQIHRNAQQYRIVCLRYAKSCLDSTLARRQVDTAIEERREAALDREDRIVELRNEHMLDMHAHIALIRNDAFALFTLYERNEAAELHKAILALIENQSVVGRESLQNVDEAVLSPLVKSVEAALDQMQRIS